jgi:putative ABC transport system permease protein
MYSWEGLLRSPTRTILNILNTATSIALMTLFFSVLLEQHGSLSGTLLGQFILVQVKGYHLGIAGVGMLLTVFSVMNNLVAGVIARRREIGVLKALGWRDVMLTRLFLEEGISIGLMGGLLGVVTGVGIYATLYGDLTSALLWVGLVGVGVACVVGCLGGLYPSFLATRVLPAEAVRHE